jgi:diguanylate cyclase (GGDEF)-like protein
VEPFTNRLSQLLRGSAARSNCPALLVHLYPPGPNLGHCYPLTDAALVVGRDEDCNIASDEPSVSRRHARIEPCSAGYKVIDLQSTNGTYINNVQVTMQTLKAGDYLRVGACIYRFLAGENLEALYQEEIHCLRVTDGLTGAANQRGLIDFLEQELGRSSRYGRPLSLVLFDIDHFKQVNESFGPLAGDFLLRDLAARVKVLVRKQDLFARHGGEEFALALPETNGEGALALCERLRQVIVEQPFDYEGDSYSLTVSIGVVTTIGAKEMTADELIRRAEAKLQRAKRQGPDRIVA